MNCILKWLSPVSRDGNNSCPNCRRPIFDDWDRMDFLAPRQIASARMRVSPAAVRAPAVNRNVDRAPAANPHVNIEPTRSPPVTASATDAPRDGRRGPPYSPRARPLPASFPRPIRDTIIARTVFIAELFDATATASSVTATPETVAPNAPLSLPSVPTQQLQGEQQAEQGPQSVATDESRTLEMSTRDDTTSSLPPTIQRRGRRAASSITQREWENNMVEEALSRWGSGGSYQRELERWYEAYVSAARRPAVAATPAPAEAARPAEDEDNGVAAMFIAAEFEHNQHQQAAMNERKRYMWMQFCEGVVRTIEQSNDSTAFANHDLALTIINMKDLDEFMADRASESPTWRRILRTFPRLHTEMVTRFSDFRPLPSVTIDNRMALERLLASAQFDRETLHKARWYTRLSERLALGAATSKHEAAVARLTERVADLSGPSRETVASTTRSGSQPTPEETREMRRMEDYLLGRTPITIRREAAASVDAALRAGAESNFAMMMVRRL